MALGQTRAPLDTGLPDSSRPLSHVYGWPASDPRFRSNLQWREEGEEGRARLALTFMGVCIAHGGGHAEIRRKL